MHWYNLAFNVNSLTGFWPLTVTELFRLHKDATQDVWRIIGRHLAQAVESTTLMELGDTRLRPRLISLLNGRGQCLLVHALPGGAGAACPDALFRVVL